MILNLDYQNFVIDEEKNLSVDMKSMSGETYQKVMSVMRRFYSNGDNNIEKGLENMSQKEVLAVAREVIPAHCSNFQGVDIRENGTTRVAVVEDITEYGGLFPLIVPILMHLFQISKLTAEESDLVKK